jgi:hypothetical protein
MKFRPGNDHTRDNGIIVSIMLERILTKKINVMSNLLYVIAVILIISWAVGFFAYSATGLIHILLVIAVVAVILRLIRGKDPV